jgi:uncharacterized protein
MANFKEAFPGRHAILPVVHVETRDQALRNTEIAKEEGCDGVFLISMQGAKWGELLQIQKYVRREFPDLFIGINFLDLPVVCVFRNIADQRVSGVWTDNAGVDEYVEGQMEAENIRQAKEKSGWDGLYFGGVAFKYQREVKDVAKSAKIATKYMDVVVTSGKGTGSAPDLGKISAMKEAIGEHPLGIASGISPENVHQYLEIADCFLVATSLLRSGTEDFDKERVKALVTAVRG